jgi:hypothetical protein
MDTPHWVTEDADAHLLPHLRRMCARDDVPLELQGSRVEDDGTLVVHCRLEGEWNRCKAGVAAFALLGQIAESGTFVEQRESNGRLELDVVTGVVSDKGPFATHGHTLRLRVTA